MTRNAPTVTGVAVQPLVTPNPLQWWGYAFGRGLPPELRSWVWRDLTGRGWVRRHFVRTLVQWAHSLLLIALPGLSLKNVSPAATHPVGG